MSDVADKVAKAKKQVEELKKQVTKARGTPIIDWYLFSFAHYFHVLQSQSKTDIMD
jgi:hypothetical protein